MTTPRKLAINPLPWVIGRTGFDLSTETLTVALTELRAVGFDAVHADIPEGMTPAQYSDFIGGFGFRPAPGYFGADFDSATARAANTEAARIHAARQAELGLTEVFIANNLTESRMARPAVGAEASADRIAVIAEGLAVAAEATQSEGVTAALHPHVGSWIETEAEVRSILDATQGSALRFGPDVGHLMWGGSDPVSIVRDYSERVVALHLKDVDAAAASAALADGSDYWATTGVHHVWTEPGRGNVDFDAVFATLPPTFDGWFVVEVDVPNIGTAAESAAAARAFTLGHPYFETGEAL
jgi:inosose dehydratase